MTKILISILVLFALLLPLVGAEGTPNLVGNWTGVGSAAIFDARHTSPGFRELDLLGRIKFYLEHNGTERFEVCGGEFHSIYLEESETILGVISPDNETLCMVDENGQLEGRLISACEMQIVYREVGQMVW
jgi:hypothetical protein